MHFGRIAGNETESFLRFVGKSITCNTCFEVDAGNEGDEQVTILISQTGKVKG